MLFEQSVCHPLASPASAEGAGVLWPPYDSRIQQPNMTLLRLARQAFTDAADRDQLDAIFVIVPSARDAATRACELYRDSAWQGNLLRDIAMRCASQRLASLGVAPMTPEVAVSGFAHFVLGLMEPAPILLSLARSVPGWNPWVDPFPSDVPQGSIGDPNLVSDSDTAARFRVSCLRRVVSRAQAHRISKLFPQILYSGVRTC